MNHPKALCFPIDSSQDFFSSFDTPPYKPTNTLTGYVDVIHRRGGVYPHPNPAKQINFNKEDYKLPSIPSKMVRLEKKPLHKMCSGFFVYIIP
jgi:hypothetical protein